MGLRGEGSLMCTLTLLGFLRRGRVGGKEEVKASGKVREAGKISNRIEKRKGGGVWRHRIGIPPLLWDPARKKQKGKEKKKRFYGKKKGLREGRN